MGVNKVLFIVGSNSTAYTIRETAELTMASDYSEILNVIGDNEECDFSSIHDSELLSYLETCQTIHYIIGFTNQRLREKFDNLFKRHGGQLRNVLHPNAFISPSATIGYGNYIACNAIISSRAVIGDSNLINYAVSIGHDTVVGNDCVFNPGARIGGCSCIGNRNLIGANSFVYQGTKTCDDCRIDALVYLHKDLDKPITIRNINRIQDIK